MFVYSPDLVSFFYLSSQQALPLPYRMTHMISDENPNRGDRPIRKNINKIIMMILLFVALVIVLTIIFVGIKGKKMKVLHKSEAVQISAPVRA